MEDTKESIKARSKAVTSHTKVSRLHSNAPQNTPDGVEHITVGKVEAEKMRDLLARMKDVTHNWPCRMESGKMPAPLISTKYIIFAFPIEGHVLVNTVTSDGSQNFLVDGVPVIPVTSSEAK